MRKMIEDTGTTPEEAINKVLAKLGVSREQVAIEILEHGSESSLCRRPARVRVVHDPSSLVAIRPVQAAQAPLQETLPEDAAEEEAPLAAEKNEPPPENSTSDETEESETTGHAEPTAPPERESVLESDDVDGDLSNAQEDEPADLLDLALDIVSDLLDHIGIDAYLDASRTNSKIYIDIESDLGGLLIGKQGKNLDALQHVVNRIFARENEERTTIVLDTEDYRRRHRVSLEDLAFRVADRVRGTGRRSVLKEMNPYERRLVHLALKNDPDIETISEGNGFLKKIRIQLR